MNKSKIKGSRFEHDAVEILTALIENSRWKRIAGSGAIGTSLGEPLLTGDVKGEIGSYPKKFRVECKVGYSSGQKQFTLKKEWLDKIAMEAGQTYSLPFLIGKFDNARAGVKTFIVMDTNVFAEIMNDYTELKEQLDKLMEEK